MIINSIEKKDIDKIFANKSEKLMYLKELYGVKGILDELPTTIKDINNAIVDTWDYSVSNTIIRNMFKNTDKYNIGKYSDNALKIMSDDWKKLELGELKWPFHPMGFDQYVHSVNCRDISESEKDEIVKNDIIKFRRIKRINTFRNDFIEYLIVEYNSNVTPTLKHNRGLDFYINGYPFDQKVSRSVTNEFKNYYGDNWKNVAKCNPNLVAEYLYKYQDESRFGVEPRLLIVYLDEDINEEDIYNCVKKVDLNKPIEISFDYHHSNGAIVNYHTECYVILLHR